MSLPPTHDPSNSVFLFSVPEFDTTFFGNKKNRVEKDILKILIGFLIVISIVLYSFSPNKYVSIQLPQVRYSASGQVYMNKSD